VPWYTHYSHSDYINIGLLFGACSHLWNKRSDFSRNRADIDIDDHPIDTSGTPPTADSTNSNCTIKGLRQWLNLTCVPCKRRQEKNDVTVPNVRGLDQLATKENLFTCTYDATAFRTSVASDGVILPVAIFTRPAIVVGLTKYILIPTSQHWRLSDSTQSTWRPGVEPVPLRRER
jgi:hypothetical protein